MTNKILVSEVNKTTNPVDLEKKEVNEVERALEADKTKGTTESENKHFQAGWIAARAMFRKANDETKEAMKLLQFQVDNHCKEYINEVDPRFLPPLFIRTLERARNLLEALSEQFTNNDMSNPEPIDMKEVSIWKDVSEEIDNQSIIFVNKAGYARLAEYWNDEIYFIEGDGDSGDVRVHCIDQNYYGKKYCTLTDFINSFEQMQKDIEEIKRK